MNNFRYDLLHVQINFTNYSFTYYWKNDIIQLSLRKE